MLVICEDCAKKYNIDESRIKGKRARFTCNECGHIIIVDKADLTRPLLRSAAPEQLPSSSIDLLKEMEVPLSESSERVDKQVEQEEFVKGKWAEQRRKPQWKYRGIPVPVYIILAVIFSLICVSLVTGYLYSEFLYNEYLADITNQSNEHRNKLMLFSSFAFGAVWLFVLLVFTLIGRIVHEKFRQLIKNANQLAAGEYDITIIHKGPREVRDLSHALDRIRQRLQESK